MPCISIIIPSLNSGLLDQVVRAVLDQPVAGYAVEVIVVGRDEPGRMPRHPQATLIDTHTPVGPATARNIGLQHARGDLICFLDADCVPADDWLRGLVAALEAGHVVVGGGVLIERGGYWALCDDLLAFGPQLAWTTPGPRRALASLNLGLHRAVIERCGGFDETFRRPAGEDTDFCLRLRQAGYTLHCAPAAAVTHRHARRSLGAMLRHLQGFGAAQVRLHERYPALLGGSQAQPLLRRVPWLLYPAAPLLATIDTIRQFLAGALPRRYWHALPGLILAKCAWYVGFARAMRAEPQRAQPIGVA